MRWPVLPLLLALAACGGPPMSGGIVGVVLLEGRPAQAGLEVVLTPGPHTARTDALGVYTVSTVPVGTYTVSAQAPGFLPGSVGVSAVEKVAAMAPPLMLAREPAPTPPPPPPPALSVTSASPPLLTCRAPLTVRGTGFGASRGGGRVQLGATEVAEYLSWSDTELRVLAPAALPPGPVDVTVTLASQKVLPRAVHAVRPVSIAMGWGHALVLEPRGSVTGWGENTSGQASPPFTLTDAVAVSADGNHGLALKSDGTVVAWGNNLFSQGRVPAGLSGVVAVEAGYSHNLALKADGTVAAWGTNTAGQLDVPAGLAGVVAVSAGTSHSVAVKADGTVVAWGDPGNGRTAVPAGLTDVVAVSAGHSHTVVLKRDGTVVAWGTSENGASTVPAGLGDVVAVSAGSRYSLALKADGTVVAWGDLNNGFRAPPASLRDVVAVAAGLTHPLALRADGSLVAWGTPGAQTQVPSGTRGHTACATAPAEPLPTTGSVAGVATLEGAQDSSGVEVALSPGGRTATTDAQGRYSLSALAPGSYTLEARREGYASRSTPVTVVAGSTVAAQALVLAPLPPDPTPGRLTGTVTLQGAAQHGNVTVALTPGDHATLTDGSGAFALEGVPGGTYTLRASAVGYTSRSIQVVVTARQTAEVPALTLQPAPPGRITGVVTLQGRASWGVGVLLSPGGRTALTNDAGAYAFEGVPAGTYTLRASPFGYVSQRTQVEVTGGQTVQASPLTLQAVPPDTTGSVIVRATLASAPSSSDVQVTLVEPGLQSVTDARGEADFSAVPPGTYTVLAQAPGYLAASTTVTVRAGDFLRSPPLVLGRPHPTPAVPSFLLARGHVTLKGSGFGASRGGAQVRFGDALVADYLSWTDTEVKVVAPADLQPGPVVLTVVLEGGQEVLRHTARVLHTHTLAAGWGHSLGLRPDGTVVAWGSDMDGATTVPEGLRDVVSLAPGGTHAHSLVLRADGTVVVWGANLAGEGTVPTGLADVVAVWRGGYHNLALRSDGTVVAWGAIESGASTVPAGLQDVVTLSAAPGYNLALHADGTVTAWGAGASVPSGLTDVTALSAGDSFHMALRADGTVAAWGSNAQGELDGAAALRGITAVSASRGFGAALREDGTVVTWGATWSNLAAPAGLGNVVAIATGLDHVLALRQDGTVAGWGREHEGWATPPAGLVLRVP
jgi:alpha-tubulin suppressor-like RCC1 family protein